MDSNTDLNAKVAIPRLRRPDQQHTSLPKATRVRSETVNKACMRCRKRKTKCSGSRPRCTACERLDDECVYEQPRRDRLRDALYKSETLTALLNDIRAGLNEDDANKVEEILQQFKDDTPPSTPTLPMRSMEKRPRSESDSMGRNQNEPNAEVDGLGEDVSTDQRTGSVGYLGRNSQVQWMRSLQRKLEHSQDESFDTVYAYHNHNEEADSAHMHTLHERSQGNNVTQPLGECYFYLDNTPINELGDIDSELVPSIDTAKRLFKFYQNAVNTPFRILDIRFGDQLQTYYEMVQNGIATNICPRWKAMFNLVFAIGSHFSHLLGETWQPGKYDHHVYMLRAVRLLGFDRISNSAGPPNQSLIQATGLLAFYFMITGHVNRAWNMIGISLRHAQAAGFHLQNEDPSTNIVEKRNVAQIWRALHSVECILTSITGRPRIINPQDCTVPLLSHPETNKEGSTQSIRMQKTPISDGTSESFANLNMDMCLAAWTRLDVIQHEVLSSLYSPKSVRQSWNSIQARIASLMTEMDEWAQDALATAGSGKAMVEGSHQTRGNILLFFYYQSARICVTRPCLCRLDRRGKDRNASSSTFVQDTADACIQAALYIACGLPRHTSYRWLYEMGPWWSGIHIIMQSITVLLLELTQRTSNLSKDPFYIFACVENLVQWLKSLKAVDRVAENAYRLVCDMLRKYKRYTKDAVPEQWLADETELPLDHEDDANMFAEVSNQTDSTDYPQQQYTPHPTLYPVSLNHDIYTGGGGSSNKRPLHSPTPLDDDAFESSCFGQTQYTPLYNSQFTTLFDQEMGDESDDAHGRAHWNSSCEWKQ